MENIKRARRKTPTQGLKPSGASPIVTEGTLTPGLVGVGLIDTEGLLTVADVCGVGVVDVVTAVGTLPGTVVGTLPGTVVVLVDVTTGAASVGGFALVVDEAVGVPRACGVGRAVVVDGAEVELVEQDVDPGAELVPKGQF